MAQVAGYVLDLYCDAPDCETSGSAWNYVEPNKRLAIEEARRVGWVIGKKDTCPMCSGHRRN